MIPQIQIAINLLVIICLAWIVGKVNLFVLIVLEKWGVMNWYDMNRARWMPKRCEFCLSFWMSWIILGILMMLLGTLSFNDRFIYLHLLIPIIAPVITITSK